MRSTDALQSMALKAVSHVKNNTIVGLGSGSTVSVFVKTLAKHVKDNKLDIRVMPTSLQIKLEAEALGFKIADETLIPSTDIVFDGADQIDAKFNMIKGGGGALLREKVLIHASKQTVILADESKYVDVLTKAVPIEVIPYARTHVINELKKMDAQPNVRSLDKGYPFITENGNLILDTNFKKINDVAKMELQLKNIAGVMEVGLFSKHADKYYKAKKNSAVEVLTP
ncbi:MAG TPA: ribose-5-phosphate isomerase RpiA [Nitrososphaerales archaeon]|nr:ribose-5-phosphate isomerase RpiA [Nitrososphaerales archaeon]